MARGSIAKNAVIEKIKEAFDGDYVATIDGKVYVWANDGGEKVQIALSLTCPKTMVNADGGTTVAPAKLDFGGGGGWDFEAMDQVTQVPEKSKEITQEEQNNIETMMRSLGLM